MGLQMRGRFYFLKKYTLTEVHKGRDAAERVYALWSLCWYVFMIPVPPASHPSQVPLDLLYPEAEECWGSGSESWHYHFLTVLPWASDSSSVKW